MTRIYSALFSMALLLGGCSVAAADGFTTVLNVPPDTLDSLVLDSESGRRVVPSGTQVNLTAFPSFTENFEVLEGGELNYFADSYDSILAAQGGVVRIFEGSVLGYLGSFSGGQVHLMGGHVDREFAIEDAEATISGGIVGSLFVEGEGGSLLIEGGEVQSIFWIGSSTSIPVEVEVTITGGDIMSDDFSFLLVSGKSTLSVSGGNFHFQNIQAGTFATGSQVNFSGYDFAIDGVPVPGLASGVPMEVFDRDVTLSGRLVDGSPFSLVLDSQQNPYTVHAPSGSHVTVTYAIPEPGAFLLALLGMACAASGRIRSRVFC